MLGNVAALQTEDWDWLPSGGGRTVREIFEHAAIRAFRRTDDSWDPALTAE